jgi:hypothetical protein
MKYINEDYKNYYKQRLLENILLEVSNPGSPGEASSEQETAGIRDILGRIGRFFRRPTPVSLPRPRTPSSIAKYVRKNMGFRDLFTGGVKYGTATGPRGVKFEILYNWQEGRWYFRKAGSNDQFIPTHKDFKVPDNFQNGDDFDIPAIVPFLPLGLNDSPQTSEFPEAGPNQPYDPYYNPIGWQSQNDDPSM